MRDRLGQSQGLQGLELVRVLVMGLEKDQESVLVLELVLVSVQEQVSDPEYQDWFLYLPFHSQLHHCQTCHKYISCNRLLHKLSSLFAS